MSSGYNAMQRNAAATRYNSGFTLTEMLVIITIMAIAATIAVPSIITSLKSLEANTISNALRAFIHNGQQHALIQQQPIILCIADSSNKCIKKNGTILLSFIDKNNDQKFDENIDVLLEKTVLTPKYGYLNLITGLNKPMIQLSAGNGQALGYMGHIKYCTQDGSNANKFKISFNKNGIPKHISSQEENTDC